jgi:hypothetical protein
VRIRRIVLVAVASCSTALSPVLTGLVATPAVAVSRSASTDLAYVEQVLYRTSMSGFVALASGAHDPWFDWSTDWCSAPGVGSTGRSFDFRWPCRRHDFGYRNLHLLERRYGTGATFWNPWNRLRVDMQLMTDMKAHCAARPWYEEATCRAWAATFYAAVRGFG